AALGGDSTQLGVTPGPASATSATTNQETHAPTNSGGTGGMRPLSAEIPPSLQCAAHTALSAEGSSASQPWPWSWGVSAPAATAAAGVPGRSRQPPWLASANWDQSNAAIARRAVRWNQLR